MERKTLNRQNGCERIESSLMTDNKSLKKREAVDATAHCKIKQNKSELELLPPLLKLLQ